jgi:succinate dehydrogenase hydrophobic anchor subunit
MEEQPQRLKLPIVEVETNPSNDSWYRVISVLLIVAALVFAGVGWYTVYNDTYSAKVVGGDAYNFIIYATRGTALVCVGIVCAVLSVTFSIFAHTARQN